MHNFHFFPCFHSVQAFMFGYFLEVITETYRMIAGHKLWGEGNGAEEAFSTLVGVETDLVS